MTDPPSTLPIPRVVPMTSTSVGHPGSPSKALVLVLALLGLSSCASDARRGDPDVQVRWEITPSSPSVGRARIRLVVSDAAWRPRNGAHVMVIATRDSMRMAVDTARGQGAGQYVIDDFVFQVGGRWVLTARVETPDGHRTEVDHAVEVGARTDPER